jgi:ABC-type uncharacterized transport system substrate-binding protein
MQISSPFKSLLLAAVLLVLPAARGFAHPHVWVSVETTLVTGANQEILGFRHVWTFDEFYSEFAVQGLDTDNDGIYSEEELKPLAQTNVEALKEFEYFTYPFLAKTKLPLGTPAPDYRLVYKDKLLTLTFTVPLASPVPRDKVKDFNFSIYDPGMYVAMTFVKNAPVKVLSEKPFPCSVRVGDRPPEEQADMSNLGENIDPASNAGARFAERVSFDCK